MTAARILQRLQTRFDIRAKLGEPFTVPYAAKRVLERDSLLALAFDESRAFATQEINPEHQ